MKSIKTKTRLNWASAPNLLGRFPVLLASTFCGSQAAQAQSISYVGSALGIGSGWRHASVAKPLDADGDNIFGTDGYVMYAASGVGSPSTSGGGQDLVSLPSYLTVATSGGASHFAGPYSYIDQPTPSGYSGLMQSGIVYKVPFINQTYDFVTITLRVRCRQSCGSATTTAASTTARFRARSLSPVHVD